jgi:hypothetical protein
VAEDPLPVTLRSGHKLHCGVCHTTAGKDDWKGRCRRCTMPLTLGYLAPKPQQELKPATLVSAAQVSFDDALADVELALEVDDEATALRRLDTAIAYGTVLRAVASSTGKGGRRQAEPLTLTALIDLHLRALQLHSRFAACFTPEAFELSLLRRLAAMYAPEGHDDLPWTTGELVAFCASRAEFIEAECGQVNTAAATHASSYEWMSLRVALARLGHEFEVKRTIGTGPFAPNEHGRRQAAALLGVDVDVVDQRQAAALKKAYYREAAKHHPDRLGDAPDDIRRAAEERMKEINAAYELLTA